MKYFYILLFVLGILSSKAQQPVFSFNADHTSILVKDLKVSAKFYGEILGLKEIYNAGLGSKFRWFQLTYKVQIHLIESENVIKPHKEIHLAINTKKLPELMEYFHTKDIYFENWQGEPDTTNTRPDDVKQIYIKDPDGYWLEINDNKL